MRQQTGGADRTGLNTPTTPRLTPGNMPPHLGRETGLGRSAGPPRDPADPRVPCNGIRLSDWLPQWLELKRPALAPKTFSNYAYVVHRHLLPLLGARPLHELTPHEVRNAYLQLADQGFSKSLLHQVKVILRQALQDAMFEDFVGRNVADGPRLPSFRQGRTARALNPGEVKLFLESARTHRLGQLFEFVIGTGLRRGEVCALKWTHLDLEAGLMHVQENITVVNGKAMLGEPKTEAGIRTVHLAPETSELLRRQRRAQQASGWCGASHVFTNAQGGRLYPDSLTKLAGKIAAKAGVGPLRFHDLRHTYASLMMSRGVPVEVVSEKLGHSRPSITADLYRHIFVEEHERHTLALTELLRPAPLRIRHPAPRAAEEPGESPAA